MRTKSSKIQITYRYKLYMEFHKQQLLKHCRVCGRRLCKAKGRAPVFDCSKHSSDLLTSFGVDVSGDDQHVFPPKFCNPCHTTLKKDQTAREKGIPRVHTVIPFIWTEHTSNNCSVRHPLKTKTKKLIRSIVGLSTL